MSTKQRKSTKPMRKQNDKSTAGKPSLAKKPKRKPV